MKRMVIFLVICGIGTGVIVAQSLSVKAGIFIPALRSDLWDDNLENLSFNRSDMINSYYGAEFELFLNRYVSASIEIGSYRKNLYAQYKDYTYPNGSPIFQSIVLKITPIEANMKLYPLGRRRALSPFFGAGVGLYAWTYQQWGSFVIFPDGYIQDGFAETRTVAIGFNGRAGLVFRFHPRVALSLEGKYQYLRGRLSGYFEGFELLDLGGITATIGVNIFFR